jgi:hypothetical protein
MHLKMSSVILYSRALPSPRTQSSYDVTEAVVLYLVQALPYFGLHHDLH